MTLEVLYRFGVDLDVDVGVGVIVGISFVILMINRLIFIFAPNSGFVKGITKSINSQARFWKLAIFVFLSLCSKEIEVI